MAKRAAAKETSDTRQDDSAVQASTDLSCLVVEIARSHDRAAFARLFSYFAPRLKSYFRQRGMASAQAEELAQETLLLVWRKASLFDPAIGAASNWIFTIARNLCHDALRQEHHSLASDDALKAVSDEAPDPEQALIVADDKDRLRRALADLPEPAMRVVTLAYFQDKSHSTIKLETGIPLGTVKARIRRTLLRLRAAMDET